MLGIIDRFEDEYAVVELEDDRIVDIKRKDIPHDAQEGSVLNVDDNITVNYEETEKRKKKIDDITKNLWE